jgi:hypothetical protein
VGLAVAGIDVDIEVVVTVFVPNVGAGIDTVIEVLRPCEISASV